MPHTTGPIKGSCSPLSHFNVATLCWPLGQRCPGAARAATAAAAVQQCCFGSRLQVAIARRLDTDPLSRGGARVATGSQGHNTRALLLLGARPSVLFSILTTFSQCLRTFSPADGAAERPPAATPPPPDFPATRFGRQGVPNGSAAGDRPPARATSSRESLPANNPPRGARDTHTCTRGPPPPPLLRDP